MISLTFLLTALMIIATPGTGNVYTIVAGLSRGTTAGIWAAFACTLGIIPHLLAAVTGLAAIMHASALAFNVIKWLGVLYLLYMAWGMWHDKTLFEIEKNVPLQNALQVIRHAIAINLLNPKLTIFFFAFLPQFIDQAQSELLQMLKLGGLFMLLTFIIFAMYGIFAGTMRHYILNRPNILNRIRKSFSLAFFGLSVKLASSER